MNMLDLLTQLRTQGISVSAREDTLIVNAPPGALTPELTTLLKDHKPALVDFLAVRSQAPVAVPVLPRGRERTRFPLSFAQAGLWFLTQVDPDSPFYNIGQATWIEGPLDADALERALASLIERHESLRTGFGSDNGEPYQQVEQRLAFSLERCVAPPLATAAERAWVDQRALACATRPFDLARPPLLRAELCALAGGERHVLLMAWHHIVSDGVSVEVFNRELRDLYGAFTHGLSPALPTPRIQYADHADWQRRQLDGPALEQRLRYWQRKLEGAPQRLQLPLDAPRPPVQTLAGANHVFSLGAPLVERLTQFSRSAGISAASVLQTAVALFLHKYAGQDDLLFGTPVANRVGEETQDLIGFFVNLLPLRSTLDPARPLGDMARALHAQLAEALSMQDTPFEKIVERCLVDRDPAFAPLFQVMFSYWHGSATQLDIAGLRMRTHKVGTGTAKLDLIFDFRHEGAEITADIEYNRDLFPAETIARIERHFRHVLDVLCSQPETPAGALDLLDEQDRELILRTWNRSATDYPRTDGLQRLFEQAAATFADRPALRCADVELSYRDLNAQANALAHALRASGVARGTLVALLLDRSADMVIATLAIIKAGAAYVPLDTEAPAARLEALVRDNAIAVTISRRDLLALAPGLQCRLLLLDEEADSIAAQPHSNPPAVVDGESLAYVMFTSGSTGQPKGVMIRQQSVARLVLDTNYIRIAPEDCIGQVLRFSFDAATFDIWAALLNGACLAVLPDVAKLSLSVFDEELKKHRVTVLSVTTALFNLMVAALPRSFDGLRCVIFGGEGGNLAITRRFLEHSPHQPEELIYTYGPTENTTFSTWIRLQAGQLGDALPIGKPISNTTLYVLDKQGRPVPVGVPGELYVGGDGVAAGYLNRPDLSELSFVPDPYADGPGARLYRTGDMVKWLPSGDLLFINRGDDQVKIRGFRVELAEVEACIARHPGIEQVAVLADREPAGTLRLLCYYVRRADGPDDEAVRLHAAGLLPSYMVPTRFVALDQMPLTPNGKVDRRALPTVPYDDAGPGAGGDASHDAVPASPRAQELAALFADVLGLQAVGSRQNFFSMGGHSLRALQLLERIRQQLGLTLKLTDFLLRPTPADLAAWLDERPQAASDETQATVSTPLPLARTELTSGPLSSNQERLWFLEGLAMGDTQPYVIADTFELEGPLDADLLVRALRHAVQHQSALRTRFVREGATVLQSVQADFELPLDRVDLSGQPDGPVHARALALTHGRRRFDLSQPPLRLLLVRLAPDRHLMQLAVHHINADGWSMGVFYQQVSEFHAVLAAGRDPSPTPLPASYLDYALGQRAWMQGAESLAQADFWRERLAGPLPVCQLPFDFQRPTELRYQGDRFFRELPQATADGLRRLCQQYGVTLYSVFLAGFKVLLRKYTGQDDLIVGTVVSGRKRPEFRDLVGFFVNTVPVRTDATGNPPFDELLRQVQARAIEAFEHDELPFDALVQAVQPERIPGVNPVFQVMFAYQAGLGDGLRIPQLTCRRADLGGQGTAMFDLSLDVFDEDGRCRIAFEYSTELFEPGTVHRLAEHYLRLLASIGSAPQTRIAELAWADADERHRMVVEWNATAAPFPREQTVHGLFEAAVQRHPDLVAIRSEDECLSYRELDARAERVAAGLLAMGLAPEARVAVCYPSSAALIVAILGILKAGACYVPLDAAYPDERLQHIVRDAGALKLLADAGFGPRAATLGLQLVDLDAALRSTPAAAMPATKRPAVSPSQLAYVLYTSGTTGAPKGVMVEHRSIVNYCYEAGRRFRLTPQDRVLQFHPITFDVSGEEIFPTLAAGAQIVMKPAAVGDSIHAFAQLALDQALTVLDLPSAFWKVYFDAIERGTVQVPPSLKLIVIGGEFIEPEHVMAWHHRGPAGVRLLNSYGPTEATISTTLAEYEGGPAAPNLGRPNANTRVYILDEHQALVPVGVAGEICIAGDSLARGYLGRPDLTAERFIDCAALGERLYRTGDLGRFRADGSIDYLGRCDTQVKIRGYRIELGDVQSKLAAHPAIRESTVVCRDLRGTKHLVGYFATRAGASLSEGALRAFMRGQLPEHMVPSFLVALEALPTTRNGKIDTARLPAPAAAAPAGDAPMEAGNALEAQLCALWARTLKLPTVGVNEGFFDLGGHSLSAFTLVHALQTELHLAATVPLLFANPSVRAFAEALGRDSGTTSPLLLSLSGDGPGRKLFLLPPSGGAVSCYQPLARAVDEYCASWAIQEPMLMGLALRFDSLSAMAARYAHEIRTLQPRGPYLIGGWSMGAVLAAEIAWQLEDEGEEATLLLVDPPEPQEMLSFDAASYSSTAFAAHLRAQLGPEVSEDAIRTIGDANLYHLELLARYEPRQHPARGIVFKAAGDSPHALQEPSAPSFWQRPGMQAQALRGDHVSVIKDAAALATIAAALRSLTSQP